MTREKKEQLIRAYVEEAIVTCPEILSDTLIDLLSTQPDKYEQHVADFLEYLEDLGLGVE
jgi:hypothetical protein